MFWGITWQQFIITMPLIFLSGMLDAISGGGGLVSLPAFLFAGLPAHMAIGTNKLSAGIGLLASTGRYITTGCIDKPLIVPSIICALIGAAFGARLSLMVSETIIRYLMVFILPVVAFMVFRQRDLEQCELSPIPRSKQIVRVLIFTFLCALYDGFYGPGSGTFMLLTLTQFAKLPVRIAEGNIKIIGLGTCISSIAIFWMSGNVFVSLGLITSVASMAGHFIGSGLVIHKGARIVRPIVLFVLALLFVRVLLEMTGVL